MINRIISRMISIARKLEGRITPTSAHRKWVERWARHGGERELDIIDVLVDSRRGALDVGANGGVYTSRLSALSAQVWAIEPHPELCDVIRRARYKNVRVVEAAVSDHSGSAKLSIPIRDDGELSLPCATLEPIDKSLPIKEIDVQLITLDEFSDKSIGFVKIDIEGHELTALHGARGLFAKHRPNVIVEIENDQHHERIAPVTKFFASLGYLGYFLRGLEVFPIERLQPCMQDRALLDKRIPRRESLFVNNFIFVPKEVAADVCSLLTARLEKGQ